MEQETNTTVIGAGIIGLATALWLQRFDQQVTLIDHQSPGQGTSFGNACMIAKYACHPLASKSLLKQVPRMIFSQKQSCTVRLAYIPTLIPWSIRFFLQASQKRIAANTKALCSLLRAVDDGYLPLFESTKANDLLTEQGSIHLYEHAKAFQEALLHSQIKSEYQIPYQHLTYADIEQLEPNISRTYHGGIFYPDCYMVRDPYQLSQRFFKQFLAQGGRFINSVVNSIQPQDNKLSIELESNQNTESERLVITAGAWSKPLCQQLGDKPSLETERGYHLMYQTDSPLLNHPICYPNKGFYLSPMNQSTIRAAGLVEMGGLKAPACNKRLNWLHQQAISILPDLTTPQSNWLGFRPSMPDTLPVISASNQIPNVYYGFGHGHLGLTLAGITGKLLAELICTKKTSISLAPFNINR